MVGFGWRWVEIGQNGGGGCVADLRGVGWKNELNRALLLKMGLFQFSKQQLRLPIFYGRGRVLQEIYRIF